MKRLVATKRFDPETAFRKIWAIVFRREHMGDVRLRPSWPRGQTYNWTMAGRKFSAMHLPLEVHLSFELNGTRYEVIRFATEEGTGYDYEWRDRVPTYDDLVELMLLL